MRTALAGSRRVLVFMAQAPLLLPLPHIASQALSLCVLPCSGGPGRLAHYLAKEGELLEVKAIELMGEALTAPAIISLYTLLMQTHSEAAMLPWHFPGTL